MCCLRKFRKALALVLCLSFVVSSTGAAAATPARTPPMQRPAAAFEQVPSALQPLPSPDEQGPDGAHGPQAALQLETLRVLPSGPQAGEQLTAQIGIHNGGGATELLRNVVIAVHGPNACAYADPLLAPLVEWRVIGDVSIPPGASWGHTTLLAGAAGLSAGVYFVELLYEESAAQPYAPLFRPTWFDVTDGVAWMPFQDCLTVVEPLRLEPPNPRPGEWVTASFSIENRSGHAVVLEVLRAAGRYGGDWGSGENPNADFPDAAAGGSIRLEPGERYDYSQMRTYDRVGPVFAEPWRREMGIDQRYLTGGMHLGERANAYVADWVCTAGSYPMFFQGAPSTLSTLPARPRWHDRAMGDPGSNPDGDTYDTVGRWGCFLSSFAMMFSRRAANPYETRSTNPGIMNTWLRAENRVLRNSAALTSGQLLAYAAGPLGLRVARTSGDLRSHLCSGQPAILHVNNAGHYVLATGLVHTNGYETIAINDPVWGQTTLAERYGGQFDDYELYTFDSDPRAKSLSVTLTHSALVASGSAAAQAEPGAAGEQPWSPAQFVLVAPDGSRTGVDLLSGQQYSEIPDARYNLSRITGPDGASTPVVVQAFVPNPGAGVYQVEVQSSESTGYQVETTLAVGGGAVEGETHTGIVEPGAVERVSVPVRPGEGAGSVYLPLVSAAVPPPVLDPKVRVEPAAARRGEQFTAYGSGFKPGYVVLLFFRGPDLVVYNLTYVPQVRADGTFASTFRVMEAVGPHLFWAQQIGVGAPYAETTFTVLE